METEQKKSKLQSLIQVLCDPENQPHQFVSEYVELEKEVTVAVLDRVKCSLGLTFDPEKIEEAICKS
jgi:hypothetical protein